MRTCLSALTMVLAAGAASAQAADPLESAGCLRALEALQAGEAAAAAVARGGAHPGGELPGAERARLEVLRERAAEVCLGARPGPPAPVRRPAAPPVAVPPVTIRPAPSSSLPPQPPDPATAPAVRVEPAPAIVTSCDATGCWASDGTRLQRAGPLLLGPRGFCSVHAALLQCP